MTRDDIIRMAREAGALQVGFNKTIMQSEYSMFAHELERFAAHVAAAERQRLHDVFMAIHHAQTHRNNYWRFAANQVLKCEDLPEFRL